MWNIFTWFCQKLSMFISFNFLQKCQHYKHSSGIVFSLFNVRHKYVFGLEDVFTMVIPEIFLKISYTFVSKRQSRLHQLCCQILNIIWYLESFIHLKWSLCNHWVMVLFRRRLITFWNEDRYEKRFGGETSCFLISNYQ